MIITSTEIWSLAEVGFGTDFGISLFRTDLDLNPFN